MLKYLLSILLFVSVLYSDAQTNKYFDDIKKTFDKKGQDELNDISKALKAAQKSYEEGEKLFSSKEISKALSKSKKASSAFNENYRKLYKLYDNKLNSLINETDGDKKEYLKKQLQDAKNYFRVAIYNRLKAGEEKEDKTVYDLLAAAHKNELLAVEVMSRIFALLNGWETADYTVEEIDYNPEDAFVNVNTRNYTGRSFSVNDPALNNSYRFNHRVAGTGNNPVSDNKNNSNSDEGNTNYNNYSNTGIASADHEFRIQIGTSILPANESQLKRLNKTDKPVSTYKSKVYYKYTVGSFSSFQEAKNFKNAYGLTNVYIVEYRKGKEVKFYMKDYQ